MKNSKLIVLVLIIILGIITIGLLTLENSSEYNLSNKQKSALEDLSYVETSDETSTVYQLNEDAYSQTIEFSREYVKVKREYTESQSGYQISIVYTETADQSLYQLFLVDDDLNQVGYTFSAYTLEQLSNADYIVSSSIDFESLFADFANSLKDLDVIQSSLKLKVGDADLSIEITNNLALSFDVIENIGDFDLVNGDTENGLFKRDNILISTTEGKADAAELDGNSEVLSIFINNNSYDYEYSMYADGVLQTIQVIGAENYYVPDEVNSDMSKQIIKQQKQLIASIQELEAT